MAWSFQKSILSRSPFLFNVLLTSIFKWEGWWFLFFLEGFSVESHQNYKKLYSLAVKLVQEEEQVISIRIVLEQESRFDDEIYESLAEQLYFAMKASEKKENSNRCNQVADSSQDESQEGSLENWDDLVLIIVD